MSTTEQENRLLKGLAQNNKTDIEVIYKENYPIIQSFILNNNGSIDDAKDIFQEAVMVLYQKANDPLFELNCKLKTFIYSICRRLWLKRLQQMQRHGSPVDNYEETVSVDEDIEDHEKKDADFDLMENALSKIGEPCKSLLGAYYLHDKNMQQIAEDFGYTSSDNAKTQKYKCLVRLKKIFFAQYKYNQTK